MLPPEAGLYPTDLRVELKAQTRNLMHIILQLALLIQVQGIHCKRLRPNETDKSL